MIPSPLSSGPSHPLTADYPLSHRSSPLCAGSSYVPGAGGSDHLGEKAQVEIKTLQGKQRTRAKMAPRIQNGVTLEPGGISLGWAVIGGQGVCRAGSCLEVLHHQSYQKTDFGDRNDDRLQSLVLLCVLLSPRVSPSILFLADGPPCAFFFPSNSRERLNVEQRMGFI